MAYKKLDIIHIEWLDHTHLCGWHDPEDMLNTGPAYCRTVGFYLGENKESIYLSLSAGKDGYDKVADAMVILKGCIKKIKKLKG